MTVRVSKPAINLREKVSELDKPTGLKGNELMRSETSQEVRDFIGAGRKNLFINGGFDIWQRATSSTATGYVAADRWYHNLSGASMTFSRQTHTDPIDGSLYYARLASTSSDDNCGFRQRVENVQSVPEGKVTVSFWARGHVNGNLAVWGTIHYGSGGSSDVDLSEKRTPYLENDTTFRKYSLTFTIPSHSGKTFGTNSYFEMSFGQGSGDSASAWTLDISNIQLEVGEYATEFEHRSYGEELKLCERYYERYWQNNNSNGPGGGGGDGYNTISGGAHNGSNGYYTWAFRTQKRARPSVGYAGKFRVIGGSSIANQVPDEFYSPGADGVRIRVGHSGSAGKAFVLEFDGGNSSNGYLEASAEL